MSRAIMQQALDALNTCDWDYDSDESPHKTFDEDLVNAAAAALKEALAKPEQTMTPISPDQYERLCFTCGACVGKPWVGLTDEDAANICMQGDLNDWHDEQVINAVEAKLKEKNDGSI